MNLISLEIVNCPLCEQSHIYKLKIERVLSLISGPPAVLEFVFGKPADEVTSLTQEKIKRYSKSFFCPVRTQSYNYTFLMKDTQKSSIYTLEVGKVVEDNITPKYRVIMEGTIALRTVDINRKLAKKWYYKGEQQYIYLENPAEAIIAFEKALELNPNHDSSWYYLAGALTDLDKLTEACNAYDKLLEIIIKEGNKHHSLFLLALCGRGEALSRLGKHQEALKAIEKALELNPKFISAWIGKGKALKRHGKYEEAIKAYEKALEIRPGDTYVLYQFASLYSEIKQIDTSLDYLDQAIKFNDYWRKEAQKDPCFDNIRDNPRFKSITIKYYKSFKK